MAKEAHLETDRIDKMVREEILEEMAEMIDREIERDEKIICYEIIGLHLCNFEVFKSY